MLTLIRRITVTGMLLFASAANALGEPGFAMIKQNQADKLTTEVSRRDVQNGSEYNVTITNHDQYDRAVKIYVRDSDRPLTESNAVTVDSHMTMHMGKPAKILPSEEYRAPCGTGWVGRVKGNQLDAWMTADSCGGFYDQVIEHDSDSYRIGLRTDWVSVPAGKVANVVFMKYKGPYEYVPMKEFNARLSNIYDGPPAMRTLENWFRWILELGEKIHSYGFGVIMLALAIRSILSPMNIKAKLFAVRSAAMKDEIEALRAYHGEDMQGLRSSMKDLYKAHRLNPVSGFMATILPMPIMIGVMIVVTLSIQLRGANFLWIPDLSRPDETFLLPLLVLVSSLVPHVVKVINARGAKECIKPLLVPFIGSIFFAWLPASVSLFYMASAPIGWLIDYVVERYIEQGPQEHRDGSHSVVSIVP